MAEDGQFSHGSVTLAAGHSLFVEIFLNQYVTFSHKSVRNDEIRWNMLWMTHASVSTNRKGYCEQDRRLVSDKTQCLLN